MAKKKKEDGNSVDDAPINDSSILSMEFLKSVCKDFGDNVVVDANYILDRKRTVIPISPAIDSICGGVPEGSFLTFTGKEKIGKSTTSLFFAATAQDIKYANEYYPAGREVYYYNIEGRLKERDLLGIPHLNRERFFVIQSIPGKILNATEYLQIADRLINLKPGSIHIFDSFSALCTDGEKSGDMADMQRADAPKLLAKFCRKVCNVVPVNNNIIIGITHQMSNVTGYGSPWSEKSGNSLKYQVDIKLRGMSMKPWAIRVGEQPIGQMVEWECQNTALNIPPWGKATSYIRYGYGIDKEQELFNIACDLGIIKKGGTWFTFPMLNNEQAQGAENARQLIIDNKIYDKIYDEVRKVLGL
jgi:recombination protein RecA